MSFNTREFEDILAEAPSTIARMDNGDLSYKPEENKWSKKEIMGHLVDSSLYNLRRFTEVMFESKPYKITTYNQDELVRVNRYQNMDIEDILDLLKTTNNRIIEIIRHMTDAELALFVHLPDNSYQSVEWLIQDYVDHMKHHINQIYNGK